MKRLPNLIAPKSYGDMCFKIAVFIGLFVAWSWFWHVRVRGLEISDPVAFVVDGVVLILPFVLTAYVSIWHQLGILRSLTKRAKIDPLSQLLNRQSFLSAAKKSIAKTSEGLVMLLDADFFKRINDTYGHATGDKCIEAIGHRLSWTLRDGALAGRVGGEEFAVFLPQVNQTQAKSIAQRLGQPVIFANPATGEEVRVTLSMGAVWVSEQETLNDLLIAADDALYQAKNAGRACLVFWNDPTPVPLDVRRASPNVIRRSA